MNKKVNLDLNTILVVYKKNKDLIIPILVIAVCILIFAKVIIPQVLNFSSVQEEVRLEANKLTTLKNNLTFLTNLDQKTLDSQFETVSQALPPGKDFAGILNSISAVANLAGVSVGEFEFQVGDLTKPPQLGLKRFPSLEIVINIDGGVNGAEKFISELYKTVPLAEVTGVKVSGETGILTLSFYFKPYPPIGFNDNAPIRHLSDKDQNLINTISAWRETKIKNDSSPSAF